MKPSKNQKKKATRKHKKSATTQYTPLQNRRPLGFEVIQSELGGEHNLGARLATRQASESSENWELIGKYSNQRPVGIGERSFEVSQIQPNGPGVLMIPFERKQRMKIQLDHMILPNPEDVTIGDQGNNLGYMCNESIWPNIQFTLKYDKTGFDLSNVVLTKNPGEESAGELFVYYTDVDDGTVSDLSKGHPPSDRELMKYISWLESSKFSFEKDGDLEYYKEKDTARKRKHKILDIFTKAEDIEIKDRVMNKYLSFEFNQIRVKELLTNTWLNLYLQEYFTVQERGDILEKLNTLHQIEPWTSCYKSDRESIARLKDCDSYKNELLDKQFNNLHSQVFQISHRVQSKENQSQVFTADLSSVEVILNLNRMRSDLTLLHPKILETDTPENYGKKLNYIVMLCEIIEKSITSGRYDPRAYSIELVKLLQMSTAEKYHQVEVYQNAFEKVNGLLQLMEQRNFQARPLAKHVAEIIASHYEDLSRRVGACQSGQAANYIQQYKRMQEINDFIQNMNDAYIETTYSQGRNKEAVNGALSEQSLFAINSAGAEQAEEVSSHVENDLLKDGKKATGDSSIKSNQKKKGKKIKEKNSGLRRGFLLST